MRLLFTLAAHPSSCIIVLEMLDRSITDIINGNDLLSQTTRLNFKPSDSQHNSDGVVNEDYVGSAASPISMPPNRRKKVITSNPKSPVEPATSRVPLKHRLFESLKILCIDIGATRTKFMYRHGSQTLLIPPADSKELWLPFDKTLNPRGDEHLRMRLASVLLHSSLPVGLHELDSVVFSVPGTVEIPEDDAEATTVRNMPSFSPEFRGFDFKQAFGPLFPQAKLHAVPDNLAAAFGVAWKFPKTACGLVLVLGTAPAVATFYRSSHKSKHIELAIWQSWAWFTKINLSDPYGYCGGLKFKPDGRAIELKDKEAYKIPHPKARIRFALDSSTWKRLCGKLNDFPQHLQGNLDEAAATEVWATRAQAAVDALALRFHQVYGPPEVVVILGGHGLRCHNKVRLATYTDPEINRTTTVQVPVIVPQNDEEQQLMHLGGLAQVVAHKRAHVIAPGPDPLARGWTRGGEIYLWVRRSEVL